MIPLWYCSHRRHPFQVSKRAAGVDDRGSWKCWFGLGWAEVGWCSFGWFFWVRIKISRKFRRQWLCWIYYKIHSFRCASHLNCIGWDLMLLRQPPKYAFLQPVISTIKYFCLVSYKIKNILSSHFEHEHLILSPTLDCEKVNSINSLTIFNKYVRKKKIINDYRRIGSSQILCQRITNENTCWYILCKFDFFLIPNLYMKICYSKFT